MKKARMSVLKAQESCVTLHQFEPNGNDDADNRGIHLVIHDRTVLPPSCRINRSVVGAFE
jgi:hypothetical protein